MDELSEFVLYSRAESIGPRYELGRAYSDSSMHIKDTKLAQFIVLLQQLPESLGLLAALPRGELTEILFSAARLSGFVNPIETEKVIGTVLDALETLGPISRSP